MAEAERVAYSSSDRPEIPFGPHPPHAPLPDPNPLSFRRLFLSVGHFNCIESSIRKQLVTGICSHRYRIGLPSAADAPAHFYGKRGRPMRPPGRHYDDVPSAEASLYGLNGVRSEIERLGLNGRLHPHLTPMADLIPLIGFGRSSACGPTCPPSSQRRPGDASTATFSRDKGARLPSSELNGSVHSDRRGALPHQHRRHGKPECPDGSSATG